MIGRDIVLERDIVLAIEAHGAVIRLDPAKAGGLLLDSGGNVPASVKAKIGPAKAGIIDYLRNRADYDRVAELAALFEGKGEAAEPVSGDASFPHGLERQASDLVDTLGLYLDEADRTKIRAKTKPDETQKAKIGECRQLILDELERRQRLEESACVPTPFREPEVQGAPVEAGQPGVVGDGLSVPARFVGWMKERGQKVYVPVARADTISECWNATIRAMRDQWREHTEATVLREGVEP